MIVPKLEKLKSAEDMVRIKQTWDFIVDYQQVEDDMRNTDVHLGCFDGLVPAHSPILAAYSPVLRDLFLGQGPEYYGIRTIYLPDYKITDVERMIQLIYYGCANVKSFSDAQQLGRVLEDFKIRGREDLKYERNEAEETVHIVYYISGRAISWEPASGPPPEPTPAPTQEDDDEIEIIEVLTTPPLPPVAVITVEGAGSVQETVLIEADSPMEPETSLSDSVLDEPELRETVASEDIPSEPKDPKDLGLGRRKRNAGRVTELKKRNSEPLTKNGSSPTTTASAKRNSEPKLKPMENQNRASPAVTESESEDLKEIKSKKRGRKPKASTPPVSQGPPNTKRAKTTDTRASPVSDKGTPQKTSPPRRSLRPRVVTKASPKEAESEADASSFHVSDEESDEATSDFTSSISDEDVKGPRTTRRNNNSIKTNKSKKRLPTTQGSAKKPTVAVAAVAPAKPVEPAAAKPVRQKANSSGSESDNDNLEPSFYKDHKRIYEEAKVCRGCDKKYNKPKDASDCITDRHKLVRCYFCFGCFKNTEVLFEHYAEKHKKAGRAECLICPYCQQTVPHRSVSTHVISNHIFEKRDQNAKGGNSGVRAPGRPAVNVPLLKKPNMDEPEKAGPKKKRVMSVSTESENDHDLVSSDSNLLIQKKSSNGKVRVFVVDKKT